MKNLSFRPGKGPRGRLGFYVTVLFMLCTTVYLVFGARERAGGDAWAELPQSFDAAAAVPSGFVVVDVSQAIPELGEGDTAPIENPNLGIGPLPGDSSLLPENREEHVILEEQVPPDEQPVYETASAIPGSTDELREPAAAGSTEEESEPGKTVVTLEEVQSAWTECVVMKGQTLTDISDGSELTLKEIAGANGLKNPDRLKVGQTLLIPASRDDILKVKEELTRRKAEREAKLKTAPRIEMKTYQVRQGDSLWSIANAYDLDINTLFGCNTFKNPDVLKPGTTIQVPNQDGILYKVQKGDSLASITKKYGVHMEGIFSANSMGKEESLIAGKQIFLPAAKPLSVARSRSVSGSSSARGFRWPVVGRISSPFGWRRDPFNKRKDFHTGLDIKAPSGRTIVASKGGKVAYSGWMGGYGRVIVIDHGGGYKTLYAHCSRLLVPKGRKVSQGQAIARVGSSGRSTGPHVHFEVRYRNSAINPLKVLR